MILDGDFRECSRLFRKDFERFQGSRREALGGMFLQLIVYQIVVWVFDEVSAGGEETPYVQCTVLPGP